MELKIKVSDKDLIAAVARVYAEKLYDNQADRIFGMDRNVQDVIKEEAKKIMLEMPKTTKFIKKLLSDEKFVRKCIEANLKEKTDDILAEMKS